MILAIVESEVSLDIKKLKSLCSLHTDNSCDVGPQTSDMIDRAIDL